MKKIASLFLIPFACLAISCDNEGEGGATSGPAVLGVSVTDVPSIVEVPENQTKTFELKVTANPGPASAISVTVGTDETLVDKYNTANGTSYEMLPEAAYEISATPLTLMKYNKASAPGTLKLKGAGCELNKVYVLPLVVEAVKGDAAYEAPEDKVAYVLYKMLEAQMMGAGTQTDPYIVDGLKTFKEMGNMLKEGETVYLKLAADIDFENGEWTPIDATGTPISLDGDGHKVKNVKATTGLFSVLIGTVKNLKLDNVVIEAGAEKAGVLADEGGSVDGNVVVENVTVTNSSVTNTGYTGGLFGSLLNGDVKNVNVACDVRGNARTAVLIGHAMSTSLTDCVTSGNVVTTLYYAGGLVGLMSECTVKNCSSSGTIVSECTSTSNSRIGGLVGEMITGGSVEGSHASVSISQAGYYTGGLIGCIKAWKGEAKEPITINISKSYATGTVAPTYNKLKDAHSGGLIGRIDGGTVNITDCYSTAAIEADRWSSGFIGSLGADCAMTLTITGGFAAGDLSKLGPNANGVDTDGLVLGNITDAALTTINCTKFVAWNLHETQFCYPAEVVPLSENYYGSEGTVSQQAKKLGWDETVWDLSGDVPTLK